MLTIKLSIPNCLLLIWSIYLEIYFLFHLAFFNKLVIGLVQENLEISWCFFPFKWDVRAVSPMLPMLIYFLQQLHNLIHHSSFLSTTVMRIMKQLCLKKALILWHCSLAWNNCNFVNTLLIVSVNILGILFHLHIKMHQWVQSMLKTWGWCPC